MRRTAGTARRARTKGAAGRWVAGAGLALLLAGLLVFGALPLLWMVAASFTPEERLFAGDWPGPGEWVLDHYRALWDEQDFWVPLRNSFLVAGATTAVCVPVGALAAWAIARLRFRGKALVLGFVLAVSLFPQISPWGQVLAAATLTTVPAAAVVLAFQRRIVQGLTAGALKG